ncbi:hypothetical protein SISNIDRAFT_490946 [Sistotremastrum niveocremeum HHB9708]|uniref:F-box domain-containing protein n=1 Tax=Sistotremastrum niveocremeum HHB9708 TaxID=1314777 RepID=A0A164NDC1_9AGAM|nr:hypothetical protein SISNIDRAFT_490946 [Sistotremastrum niveocremeum HHB9708]
MASSIDRQARPNRARKPHLPPELIIYIISVVSTVDLPSMTRLARLNRTWQPVVEKELYHSVILTTIRQIKFFADHVSSSRKSLVLHLALYPEIPYKFIQCLGDFNDCVSVTSLALNSNCRINHRAWSDLRPEHLSLALNQPIVLGSLHRQHYVWHDITRLTLRVPCYDISAMHLFSEGESETSLEELCLEVDSAEIDATQVIRDANKLLSIGIRLVLVVPPNAYLTQRVSKWLFQWDPVSAHDKPPNLHIFQRSLLPNTLISIDWWAPIPAIAV